MSADPPSEAERARLRGYFGAEHAEWRRWNRARAFIVAERRQLFLAMADRLGKPFADLWICDVGCGSGADLEFWSTLGVPEAQLAGTEIMPERAASARQRLRGADIRDVDGFDIPFEEGRFDLVTASLVLSSVLEDGLRRRLFAEMRRVTARSGFLIVYDFRVRKPTNSQVVSMSHRRIRALHRAPDVTIAASPLLPALELVLRLPSAVQRFGVRLVPDTHALWAWRVDPSG